MVLPIEVRATGREEAGRRVTHTSVERQRRIVVLARQQGRVDVTELADQLEVVVETVRRDLVALEHKGLIRRVHGQAFPVEGAGFESSLAYRSSHLVPEKRRIAAATVEQIADAETVFLDEGFTPLLIAHALAGIHRPITVLTASLPVATALGSVEGIAVFVLGGMLRGLTLGTTGHWVTQMLSSFSLDVAVIGTNGISRERGLTIPAPLLVHVKQVAMQQARRKVFVGAHTKFGVDSFARFADVRDFDVLVTDRGLPAGEARRYAELGPRVLRA